jgi:DNA gyrase inhibitor GyrI
MTDIPMSEIRIETLPMMRVACRREVSATPEDDAFQFFAAWLANRNLTGQVRHFGFDVDVDPTEAQDGKHGYEVWMVLPQDLDASDGVVMRQFDGGLYAAVTLIRPFDDPYNRISGGWNILHEWVIGSQAYRGAGHQWLEEEIETPDGVNLILYHPVTKA